MDAITPFVAEIGIAAFNFAPKGWAFCNGQIMPISQNTALFSLLGTTYGGDGKSTFALPDLQGRAVIQPGQGPGLSLYDLGQEGGTENYTLLETEIPLHAHSSEPTTNGSLTQPALTATGNSASPEGRLPANTGTDKRYAPTTNAAMAPYTLSVQTTGGGLPFSLMQPYLTLNYVIALQGVFPARS